MKNGKESALTYEDKGKEIMLLTIGQLRSAINEAMKGSLMGTFEFVVDDFEFDNRQRVARIEGTANTVEGDTYVDHSGSMSDWEINSVVEYMEDGVSEKSIDPNEFEDSLSHDESLRLEREIISAAKSSVDHAKAGAAERRAELR